MTHIPALISDLALILISAAITSIVFKWLKQPVVLGYILAGILVGPSIHLLPNVVDKENISTWADIGVIVLLFGLGLEFSFRKMLKVGASALVIALLGVGLTVLSGYQLGRVLGWKSIDCLFLGGILSIASTTIIMRAFSELKVRSKQFTNTVLGVLVIEDLVAVLLLVILSTVAVSSNVQGKELITAVSKLGFFLVLWFLWGIFFLPGIFRKLSKYLTDEMLLIVALALCFGMVILASKAGFSAALGAFVMGSILAETSFVHRIEHLISSVRDLFGAVFFVSVGMLFEPKMLMEYWLPVVLATGVLLFLKPAFATIGALLTGNSPENSVRTGMSLSQIGEFSFIIAKLGVTLAVTGEFLYPIAVAVSVITTFTTPYWIRFSGPFSAFLVRSVPQNVKSRLSRYGTASQQVKDERDWQVLLKNYLLYSVLYSVILIGLVLLATRIILPALNDTLATRIVVACGLLITMLPFLWALAFRRSAGQLYERIWRIPMLRGPLIVLMVTRLVLAAILLGFAFDRLFSPLVAFIAVGASAALLLIFRKRLAAVYGRIEDQFIENLASREDKGAMLVPWDSHFSAISVEESSLLAGSTLFELQLRERFGVNIAYIERGEQTLAVPVRSERIFPGDVLGVIGTDEQIAALTIYAGETAGGRIPHDQPPVLRKLIITGPTAMSGRSIRESKIRELTRGLVVGVERNKSRILNPESDFVLETGDLLWIVGDRKRIEVLQRRQEV